MDSLRDVEPVEPIEDRGDVASGWVGEKQIYGPQWKFSRKDQCACPRLLLCYSYVHLSLLFSSNHNLPLSISSPNHSLLIKKKKKPWPHSDNECGRGRNKRPSMKLMCIAMLRAAFMWALASQRLYIHWEQKHFFSLPGLREERLDQQAWCYLKDFFCFFAEAHLVL